MKMFKELGLTVLVTAYIILVVTVSAHAQVRPETTKLTIEQADRVLAGLTALDGYDKVIKDGASERTVKVPYDLTGKLRLLIARDIDALTPAVKRFAKTRQEIVAQATAGKTPDQAEVAKVNKSVQELLDSEEQFDLGKIGDTELKLDVNPIPPSVLSQLSPIRQP